MSVQCSVHSPSPSGLSFPSYTAGLRFITESFLLLYLAERSANRKNLLHKQTKLTTKHTYLQRLCPFLSHTPLPQKENITWSTNTQTKSNVFQNYFVPFVSPLLKNEWHTPPAAFASITFPQILGCEEHHCESSLFLMWGVKNTWSPRPTAYLFLSAQWMFQWEALLFHDGGICCEIAVFTLTVTWQMKPRCNIFY